MIRALTVEECRGFDKRSFSFGSRVFVTGANGVGKSTILEAIRVLSVGKSFRTSRLEEMIRFNQDFLRLEGKIGQDEKVEFFYGSQFEVTGGRDRRLTYQGNVVSWLDFLGRFPTVLFTPADMEIVLGGPDVRRRYLDSVLWQVNPGYRHNQIELTQALREKAALLFMVKLNRASAEELQPWNELITALTEKIRAARADYVEYLNDHFQKQPVSAQLAVAYQFDPRSAGELQLQEIKSAQNLYGAHRDELVLKFDDFLARRYASRGQSRLVIAYLKAAEADYLKDKTDNPVTILLDDAFSELDAARVDQTLALFKPEHQLILTSATSLKLKGEWETIGL